MNAAPLHDTPTDPQEMLALLRQLQADSLQVLDPVQPGLDGSGRVAMPLGFALTDPGVRLSRTRLFSKVTQGAQAGISGRVGFEVGGVDRVARSHRRQASSAPVDFVAEVLGTRSGAPGSRTSSALDGCSAARSTGSDRAERCIASAAARRRF